MGVELVCEDVAAVVGVLGAEDSDVGELTKLQGFSVGSVALSITVAEAASSGSAEGGGDVAKSSTFKGRTNSASSKGGDNSLLFSTIASSFMGAITVSVSSSSDKSIGDSICMRPKTDDTPVLDAAIDGAKVVPFESSSTTLVVKLEGLHVDESGTGILETVGVSSVVISDAKDTGTLALLVSYPYDHCFLFFSRIMHALVVQMMMILTHKDSDWWRRRRILSGAFSLPTLKLLLSL